MWNRIRNIWFKELTDSLRDRKALRQSLLTPLIIGIFYALLNPVLGSVIESRVEQQGEQAVSVVAIGSQNVDAGLAATLDQFLIELDEWDGTRAELEAQVTAGDIATALIIPPDFGDAVTAEQAANITVLVNSGGNTFDIDTTAFRLRGAIEAYSQQLVLQRLQARGIDPAVLAPIAIDQVSLTTPAQTAGAQASFLLPILVAVVVVSGGMFIAIDVTAGEKERGTLESLLLTPASDVEIFVGKLLAVFTMTTVPLLLTFIGYGLTNNLLPDSMTNGAVVTPLVIFGSALIGIPLALAVNAVLMVIAVRTKTFKDAQSAVTPVTFATMFPAMGAGFFPPTNPIFYLIPAYGTGAVAGKLAAEGAMPWVAFGLSAVGCALVAAVAIYIGLRLFDRERLLYSM